MKIRLDGFREGEHYFRYHRTPEASMVDMTAIHLEGDAIHWYNWFEHTQGVPTWRQFKSSMLICFGPSKYESIDRQLDRPSMRTSTDNFLIEPQGRLYGIDL
ncbi:hypothetical protein B296_00052158 [Ensete ventricosum]|uniref:Uncharacterized protein n=1 Tax=Ensete ventricosum TaxID=4639 RepID=A0A426Y3P9_ENSVE|nr:hypothetical protein B296_00052158 [Ensete ventricosum]